MAQITYENKVKINDNPNIPAVNKGRDVDWNEVKQVVNTNYNEQQTIQNQLEDLITYSEQEVIVGKWVDGNTLYRKTIDIGSLPNNAEKSIAHNINNLNIVTKISGSAYNSEGRTFPLPALSFGLSSGLAQPSVYVFADKTNITLGTGIDRSAYSGYITIEYTKTDD